MLDAQKYSLYDDIKWGSCC